MNTASDITFRRTGIGGSDAPIIAGQRAYGRDLWSLYLEKIGQTVPTVQNQAMGLGHLLEDPLAKHWAKEHGRRVRRHNKAIRHRLYPFLFAHVDRFDDEGNIVEVKVVNNFRASQFGEDGTDQVPPLVALQVHHYLGVIPEAKRAHLIVLMGGTALHEYVIERDFETITALQTLEIDFWEEHVIPRIPPDLDGSDGATEFLRQAFPNDDGEAIEATDEDVKLADELRWLKVQIDEYETREKLAKQKLMERLAEASTMTGPDFRISYKRAKDSVTVRWRDLALSVTSDSELISQFTEVRPGSRRFILTDKSEA